MRWRNFQNFLIMMAILDLLALTAIAFAHSGDGDVPGPRILCVVKTVVQTPVRPSAIRDVVPLEPPAYAVPPTLGLRSPSFFRVLIKGSQLAVRTESGIAITALDHPEWPARIVSAESVREWVGERFHLHSLSGNGEWVFLQHDASGGPGAMVHVPSGRVFHEGFERVSASLQVHFTDNGRTAVCARGSDVPVIFMDLSDPAARSLPTWDLKDPELERQTRFIPGIDVVVSFSGSDGLAPPSISNVRSTPIVRTRRFERGLLGFRPLEVSDAFQVPLPHNGELRYGRVEVSRTGRYMLARRIYVRRANVLASGVDILSTFSGARLASFEQLGRDFTSMAISPSEHLAAIAGRDGIVVFDLLHPEIVRFQTQASTWNRMALTGFSFVNEHQLATVDDRGTVRLWFLPMQRT